jgi:hypothetical protein
MICVTYPAVARGKHMDYMPGYCGAVNGIVFLTFFIALNETGINHSFFLSGNLRRTKN